MMIWIKRKIACIRMLSRLKKVTADYNVILCRLKGMRELAHTLGEHGSEIRNDIDSAENLCKDCIKRFSSVYECLRDRDYRHINHQMIAVEGQMRIFEELTQKARTDAINLSNYYNIGACKRGFKDDLRRDSKKSHASGM